MSDSESEEEEKAPAIEEEAPPVSGHVELRSQLMVPAIMLTQM